MCQALINEVSRVPLASKKLLVLLGKGGRRGGGRNATCEIIFRRNASRAEERREAKQLHEAQRETGNSSVKANHANQGSSYFPGVFFAQSYDARERSKSQNVAQVTALANGPPRAMGFSSRQLVARQRGILMGPFPFLYLAPYTSPSDCRSLFAPCTPPPSRSSFFSSSSTGYSLTRYRSRYTPTPGDGSSETDPKMIGPESEGPVS